MKSHKDMQTYGAQMFSRTNNNLSPHAEPPGQSVLTVYFSQAGSDACAGSDEPGVTTLAACALSALGRAGEETTLR